MERLEMDEDQRERERKIFTAFEKHDEFVTIQSELIASCQDNTADSRRQFELLRKFTFILDQYQEQAYLLDPYLEKLVNPVMEQFKTLVKAADPTKKDSVSLLSLVLYHYVKFRGYKSITRFFPHEIPDLSVALQFLLHSEDAARPQWRWSLHYILLLWLSLICMLPFDLAQFDEPEDVGKTAHDLEEVAKAHLGKAGVEREGAAVMLARLYTRKDMHGSLPGFLQWCEQIAQDPNDPIPCIGAFHVLSELAKSGPASVIQSNISVLFKLTSRVDEVDVLAKCTLLRKFRTKLTSRILLRLLPHRKRRARGRVLLQNSDEYVATEDDDIDIPEETETVLQDLFKALQDRDTIVRYSSAKAVARIAERLSLEFSEQVLDQVLQLFTIHSMGAASLYDMTSIAEGTWHGACLACAEMARRSLVPASRLGDLLGWMKKALYFDIRRGANSVGSSVRDAASYVLWSTARAQTIQALEPYATDLARTLVTVAVFDREVHIRRAASAAFQEFVGRTSSFPSGIDVLRKTDFYAVGTRRHAFLVAACEVAEHKEYLSALLEHLLSVTLRHWDPTMRQLGAEALRNVCQVDLKTLGISSADRVAQYLTFPDSGDIHGALLALSELALAFKAKSDDSEMLAARRKIFSYLSNVPTSMVRSHRHELITAAACQFIARSISNTEITSKDSSTPDWRSIIDFGLKSPSISVQEAAADAMVSVSKLVECSSDVNRDARSGPPAVQQSVCRVLGVLDYSAHQHGILPVVDFLLESVDRSTSTALKNVEARRNTCYSISNIVANVISDLPKHIPSHTMCKTLDSLLAGLEDYTSDERGDVGSWIRTACIKGLTSITEMLIRNAAAIPDFVEYFPVGKYHEIVAGILKQGVERLDNVRQQAGERMIRLLELPLPQTPGAEAWSVHGRQLFKELFLSNEERIGWNEGAWLYPKVMRLLAIKEYRRLLLAGLVLSASSKTDSTQRPVSVSLVNYARGLPVRRTTDDGYDLCTLASDLLAEAKINLASNNIVIPVLQCFHFLLEGDVFEALVHDSAGLTSLKSLLVIASKNISRIKNVQRIEMSMKVIANLLAFSEIRGACAKQLPNFLTHQYPKIRASTAECLYLVLQSKDFGCETEEAEEVLLDTEWTSNDLAVINEAAQRCTALLANTATE